MSEARRIYEDPAFVALQARRSRFAWRLAGLMAGVYFAFILTVAFRPSILAVVVPGCSTLTFGIPVGVAIIVLGFVLTGLYVRRANREFDPELSRLIARYRDERGA